MTNCPLDLYLGFYQIDKLVIQVKEVDQGLAVALPGVPEGYEMSLEIEGPPAYIQVLGDRLGVGPDPDPPSLE